MSISTQYCLKRGKDRICFSTEKELELFLDDESKKRREDFDLKMKEAKELSRRNQNKNFGHSKKR